MGVKQVLDGIIMIFKGNFKQGIISIGKGIVNILIGVINGFIAGLNAILYPIRELIVQAGNILGKNWNLGTIQIPTIPKLAVGGIVNMPRKRSSYRRYSKSWRIWSRRCYSINRYSSNGNSRRRNRKAHYN